MASTFTDIKFEIRGQIGIIKFNRPKALNSFGGNLIEDTIAALRILNEHPDTVFTVLTGEGRFFSAGADVRGFGAGGSGGPPQYKNDAEKKLAFLGRFNYATELLRSMIDHKKVLILALNGPAVGGGAAWFPGIADIVLATTGSWLQCPFSALGLVPENGSALSFAQHMGIHRANDFLMFGTKLSAQELKDAGMYNYVWDKTGEEFQAEVVRFLEGQLEGNDGKSMMEMKRLQNAPIRDARLIAVVNAVDALAERFVEDAPTKRFAKKKAELEAKSKERGAKL
ncbi:peroxisomal d3,d2-enoyl-CoA isomeras-like protein [Aaosphaeria arxii CBS 175.79]|uniref:Peroxisomal d3,d2-enoyl-CoA isomeras-like protein n=1 Tax=Aaosphaeria arxii CBS 175.79 TaxID=1450172 RepID=A0A6A5YB20_9PLEO|nr:peroxisomal d3,d2-enoyl-CoA isomeras-like protein [Aaosphaeria arxii CBS 175.79]KAF2022227.1 peroxisomal d3,d2-enoyl-CoA isomeras-like protein [Aaosphaeria arxii CBS 175.79]